jgi:hypothetical protein
VAKPVKHRGKWRIRWVDEREKRQSAVFDDYKRAQTELSRRQVEVEEVKRGIRNAAPPEKTGDDIFDYWIEKRACRKRSKKDDESIIRKHLRPAFGKMRLRDIGVEEVDGYINVKIDDEELSDKNRTRATDTDRVLRHPPPRRRPRATFCTRRVRGRLLRSYCSA